MLRKRNDIERVYDLYSRTLYFTALRILSDQAEAEDVMQESIIAWYTQEKRESIKNLGGWLKTACIRRAVDIIRRREVCRGYRESAETGETSYTCDEEQDDISAGIISGAERHNCMDRILKEALRTLPDSYRMIVSLHLFEGYDYQEIASITGLSESGIRSQYMRGKAALAALTREKLKNEGYIV